MTNGDSDVSQAPYELVTTPEGIVARIRARGSAVLTNPFINRGTAFTDEQRRELGLVGLLPRAVKAIDAQLRRTYAQYSQQPSDLAKWVYLTNLRDRNEVLFYRLLAEHIEEMMPIVYTPTVGLAIERFSHEFRRPRGVYLSVDHPEEVETALRNTGLGPDDVDLLVATDSEGILGIGDQGVGGIQIAIGKLAVYTAAAGIHPSRGVAVVLDMGTDNLGLLNDEMYLGERHARVRDGRYDRLIDAYVTTANKLWPNAMLHWEDFGASNARRILTDTPTRCAPSTTTCRARRPSCWRRRCRAVRAAGTRLRDQRVVIHGAGTAGLGIADMMRDQMVREGLDPRGGDAAILGAGPARPADRRPDRAPVRLPTPLRAPASEVAGWASDSAAGRDRSGRRRGPGAADDADRHLDPDRRVHRARGPHDGRALCPADHHAAVEPHLEVRGRPG